MSQRLDVVRRTSQHRWQPVSSSVCGHLGELVCGARPAESTLAVVGATATSRSAGGRLAVRPNRQRAFKPSLALVIGRGALPVDDQNPEFK